MGYLNPKNFRIVDAGGNLAVAPSIPLEQEGTNLNIEPVQVEKLRSDSPVPDEIIQVGANIEVRGVAVGASLEDLRTQLNMSDSTLKSDEMFQLNEKDVQFEVATQYKGVNKLVKLTNCVATGVIDANYQGGSDNAFYLPMVFRSTADSVLKITYGDKYSLDGENDLLETPTAED
ncbi:MAG: hypothetical protein K9L56_14200, partial [Clostridiales bacterium]|nr:hypothetical protein [Clostridiales bacterium]